MATSGHNVCGGNRQQGIPWTTELLKICLAPSVHPIIKIKATGGICQFNLIKLSRIELTSSIRDSLILVTAAVLVRQVDDSVKLQ